MSAGYVRYPRDYEELEWCDGFNSRENSIIVSNMNIYLITKDTSTVKIMKIIHSYAVQRKGDHSSAAIYFIRSEKEKVSLFNKFKKRVLLFYDATLDYWLPNAVPTACLDEKYAEEFKQISDNLRKVVWND